MADAPLNPNLWAVVLHGPDGTPAADPSGTIPTKGVPGTTIRTPADTPVGIGATEPLPVPTGTTRRMTVQNTGPAGTWVRVRELGGTAGAGKLLPRLGEYTYGGADGAVQALEVEDVSLAVGGVAVATTICVQFEED